MSDIMAVVGEDVARERVTVEAGARANAEWQRQKRLGNV